MTNNYRIIPNPDSPYAALDFPAGIPVTHPIPIGMVDGDLLWDLDIPRTTDEQLLSIAQLASEHLGVDLRTIVDRIKQAQNFGICHEHVKGLTGDNSSPDQLEGMGRTYRVRHFLTRSNPIQIVLTIDDAICLYCESKYALYQIGDSPSGEMVDLWLLIIIREVAKHSHDLVKVLLRDEATQADFDRVYSGGNFEKLVDIEIKMSIPAYTAYLLTGVLQLRLRDPDCSIPDPIRHYLKTLESAIVQLCPESSWLLDRGGIENLTGVAIEFEQIIAISDI